MASLTESVPASFIEHSLLLWGRIAGVLIILGVTLLLLRLRRPLIERALRWSQPNTDEAAPLGPLLLSASKWLLWAAAALSTVAVLGGNVWQVMTGAGIVGVALGLGAQNVVRDVISGFFIMVENQFRPGDYVQINGEFEGEIESLDLRMTRLRGWDGAVVCIGNASIQRVKNYNRDAMRVMIDLSVPFEVDHRRVRQVLRALCQEMARTHREHFLEAQGHLIEPPWLYGVTDISSAKGVGATYTIMALTKVESYWYISRETRRLVLERLQGAGIHLSYPHRFWMAERGPSPQR